MRHRAFALAFVLGLLGGPEGWAQDVRFTVSVHQLRTGGGEVVPLPAKIERVEPEKLQDRLSCMAVRGRPDQVKCVFSNCNPAGESFSIHFQKPGAGWRVRKRADIVIENCTLTPADVEVVMEVAALWVASVNDDLVTVLALDGDARPSAEVVAGRMAALRQQAGGEERLAALQPHLQDLSAKALEQGHAEMAADYQSYIVALGGVNVAQFYANAQMPLPRIPTNIPQLAEAVARINSGDLLADNTGGGGAAPKRLWRLERDLNRGVLATRQLRDIGELGSGRLQ